MQGIYRYPPGRKWRYGQATRCCCCWLLHGGAHERKDAAANTTNDRDVFLILHSCGVTDRVIHQYELHHARTRACSCVMY